MKMLAYFIDGNPRTTQVMPKKRPQLDENQEPVLDEEGNPVMEEWFDWDGFMAANTPAGTAYELIEQEEAAAWFDNNMAANTVRDELLAQLKEVRLAHEYAGPLLTINGEPVRFPSDVKDETRLNSLALMFNIDPTLSVPDWKIADGVYVTMTAMLLADIRNAGSVHITECFSVERGKREELAALTTTAALRAWAAANMETGWPA